MCKDENHEAGPAPAFDRRTLPCLALMFVDAPQVRNYIISNIDAISDALGATGIQTGILPALLDLSKDPKVSHHTQSGLITDVLLVE